MKNLNSIKKKTAKEELKVPVIGPSILLAESFKALAIQIDQ